MNILLVRRIIYEKYIYLSATLSTATSGKNFLEMIYELISYSSNQKESDPLPNSYLKNITFSFFWDDFKHIKNVNGTEIFIPRSEFFIEDQIISLNSF